jgi:hypothetical protein
LDVCVPGVFRVPIKVIVINGELRTDVIHDVWDGRQPVLCIQTGGSRVFGGGLDRTSQMPRYLRVSRMTDGSSMLLMTRMAPFYFGQIKESTS